MKMKLRIIIVSIFVCGTLFLCISCAQDRAEDGGNKPKNVILMIGDGMGLAQMHAAMVVNNNTLNIERCKVVGLTRTQAIDDFITDSGASGTAIATGCKTVNGAIAVTPQGEELKTILEYAEDAGLSTGLVSTSSITHATPATFIAHQMSRKEYEHIALDFLNTDIEIFVGGGLDHFTKRKDGRDLVVELKEKGYFVATSLDELRNSEGHKVAGLLADVHLPKASEGRGNMLEVSVEKSLEILSADPDGFFLMVEGSQIDWGGHDKDRDYIISEALDFDRAVGSALDFADRNGETLVIVTADHETGGMAIRNGDPEKGIVDVDFTSDDHTGIMVPVFAYGPGSLEFGGIYENTGLFFRMMDALGLGGE